MQNGVIVDQRPKVQIMRNPQVEYTKRLVTVLPVPDPEEERANLFYPVALLSLHY